MESDRLRLFFTVIVILPDASLVSQLASHAPWSYTRKLSLLFLSRLNLDEARRFSNTRFFFLSVWTLDPRTASHDFITAKRVPEQVLPRNCRSALPTRLRKPIITRFRRGSRIRRPSSPRISIPSSEIARPIETLSQGNAARNIDIIYPSGTLRRGP